MRRVNNYQPDGCAILSRRDTWSIRNRACRGVCRGYWWPLREHVKRDSRAAELTSTLSVDFLKRLGTDTPDVSTNLEVLASYVVTCDRLELSSLYGLVCASVSSKKSTIPWLASLKGDCEYVGVDVCYTSGSYSFLDSEYLPDHPEIHQFLTAYLNDNGLFDSVDEAREFMRLHQLAIDAGANMETLEDVIPLELWEDVELRGLRKLFGMGLG
jgi:hypothetical protein